MKELPTSNHVRQVGKDRKHKLWTIYRLFIIIVCHNLEGFPVLLQKIIMLRDLNARYVTCSQVN